MTTKTSVSPPSDPEPQPELERYQTLHGKWLIRNLSRGMVFWAKVEEDEAVGSEYKHTPEPCPWVVISADRMHRAHALGIVIVMPLSSRMNKGHLSGRVVLRKGDHRIDYAIPSDLEVPDGHEFLRNGLTGDSVAIPEQVKTFCQTRLLGNPIAKLTPAGLKEISPVLKSALGLL